MPLVTEFMIQHPAIKGGYRPTNRTLDLVHEGLDLAIRLGRLPGFAWWLVTAGVATTIPVRSASVSCSAMANGHTRCPS